jgi:hypothetical protein
MSRGTDWSFGPILLTTTETTNLLSPGTTAGGVNCGTGGEYSNLRILLRHLWVVNAAAGPVSVSLWLGASGANAAGTEFVWQDAIVQPGDRLDFYDPNGVPIDFGQYLVGGASAGAALTLMGAGDILVR